MGGSSGGNQKVENKPWGPVQGYLKDLYAQGSQQVQNPPQFFPGNTYVGMNPWENAALQTRADFATQTYPGMYGNLLNTNQQLMGGNTPLASLGNQLAGAVTGGPQGFNGYSGGNAYSNGMSTMRAELPGMANPAIMPGRTMLGGGGGLNAAFQTPMMQAAQFQGPNPFITQNPNAALGQMLSGQPNTQMFAEALNAANEPMMAQWRNQVLPGIQQADYAATGGQGGSGALKGALLANQDMSRAMANTAGNLGFQSYQDALNRQGQGVNLATQAGLQQLGLGLQANQANAGFAQQANLANLQSRQNTQGNILQGAGLAGNMLGQATQDQTRAMALFPQTMQAGMFPADQLAQVGQGYRGFDEMALQDAMRRWDFGQNQPMNMLNWYNQLLQPGFGFGTQTSPGASSNPLMGGLGGAAAGAYLGSVVPGIGTGIGAVGGGLLGLLGGI